MQSFILPLVISIIFALLAIIFLFISLFKEKSNGRFSTVAAIFSGIITLVSILSITVPVPVILPLDNETGTYTNSLEVTIKSDESIFLETYYTLSGEDPQEEGKVYDSIITISESTTVCARNKFLWWWSDIARNPYIIEKNNNDIQSLPLVTESAQSNLKNKNLNDNPISNYQDNNIQEYPDDYIIVWEDTTFEKLIKASLHKDNITYADVKNINRINILDDEMIVNDILNSITIKFFSDDIDNFISLNDLKYFSSLNHLSIVNYTSIDCSIFEDENFSKKIISLEIWSNIKSEQIKQLTNLQNLMSLHLYGSKINEEDLKNISSMHNLKHLSLSSCYITDITPINNMTQLKSLDLSSNNISNIDILENFDNLEYVILYNNKITDFSPVSHVKKVIKTYEESIK